LFSWPFKTLSYVTEFVTADIQTGHYCFPGGSCSPHGTLLLKKERKKEETPDKSFYFYELFEYPFLRF
jgi:hypothetical protein